MKEKCQNCVKCAFERATMARGKWKNVEKNSKKKSKIFERKIK